MRIMQMQNETHPPTSAFSSLNDINFNGQSGSPYETGSKGLCAVYVCESQYSGAVSFIQTVFGCWENK